MHEVTIANLYSFVPSYRLSTPDIISNWTLPSGCVEDLVHPLPIGLGLKHRLSLAIMTVRNQ